MSLSYVVTTGFHLPKAKKVFGCYCEAINHLKPVIGQYREEIEDLALGQIYLSYAVIHLDKENFQNYNKIFLNAIENSKTELKKTA